MPRTATQNKHQLRTEATTQKLLDAAFTVFARDGFIAARIEDIVAEAGYTRGAFYAHFKTKSDLFFALLRHGAEEQYETLRAQLAEAQNPEQRRAMFRSKYIARTAAKQWCILVVEFKLWAVRQGRQREELAQIHRELRNTLHRWLGKNTSIDIGVDPDRWEAIAAALEAAMQGLVLERVYDPKRVSDADVRDLLGKIFDALIPTN